MTGEYSFFDRPEFAAQAEPAPGRELVRVIVFGSKDAVRSTIQEAHLRNFRKIETWSPLLPTPDPKVFMSISTHYRITGYRHCAFSKKYTRKR